MRPICLSLFALVSLAACRPSVKIEYMYPAEFTLPAEVKTVAVVDRVARGESGEAVKGLEDALAGSPRLAVANPAAAAAALAKVKVAAGAPLDAASAGAVCASAGASGIVSLEDYRFAGDWRYEQITEPVTKIVHEKPAGCDNCDTVDKEVTEEVPMVIATFDGATATTWQVTSCAGAPLTSDMVGASGSLEGKGERDADAREDAGDTSVLEAEIAGAVGAGFSTHISPRQVAESRRYFKSGSREIRAGAKDAKAGKWNQAQSAWKDALKSDSDKVRGKAQLNLAVSYEREGDLAEAVKHARKAKKLLDGEKGTAEYLQTLVTRQGLEQKVAQQLPVAD